MKKILNHFMAFTIVLFLFVYLLSSFSNWSLNPADWVEPTRISVFSAVCAISAIGFIGVVIIYSGNDTE